MHVRQSDSGGKPLATRSSCQEKVSGGVRYEDVYVRRPWGRTCDSVVYLLGIVHSDNAATTTATVSATYQFAANLGSSSSPIDDKHVKFPEFAARSTFAALFLHDVFSTEVMTLLPNSGDRHRPACSCPKSLIGRASQQHLDCAVQHGPRE